MQAIMQAYTEGLPEVEKDENPQTDESPEKLRLLVFYISAR